MSEDPQEHEYLLSLTREEVDALPYGVIQLDPDGVVVGYNTAESSLSGLAPERVIGRNFFDDIAPCTKVKDFGGLYQEMTRASAPQSSEAQFTYHFMTGVKRVHIRLAYFPARGRGLLLVEDITGAA